MVSGFLELGEQVLPQGAKLLVTVSQFFIELDCQFLQFVPIGLGVVCQFI